MYIVSSILIHLNHNIKESIQKKMEIYQLLFENLV
jgi:hypothetical protein